MLEEVQLWLDRHSWSATDRPLDLLRAAKAAAGVQGTVSVVLPALNEQDTVGDIVEAIREDLMTGEIPLVDEVVVMDSGSSDGTSRVSSAAGAQVVHRDSVLPRMPIAAGKGEVMWRSLLATEGEIVCFIDADLRDFDSQFVSGIIGPLLTDPELQLVKAMYDRPMSGGGERGGRVTELVARPLLNLHWPQLAGFVQPLGGEYAARRSLLERLPFPVGYGVELGMLVDSLDLAGLNALGQVDVGVRRHRNQDGQALGRMAATIYATAQRRLERGHLVRPVLTQFDRGADRLFAPTAHTVTTEERPPMITVPEYLARRRKAA
ncbi:glucosyl-3-phosphoglycerate synthase [Streptomyces zingiberis]|uniref:Glucosyl-3-phosphoglycerate synthase n=1 Tax=Streptomyces zingiberis TaxID=2053010 RepID=A0ABX1BQJ2_9ACTN|nr:glucosyl-3-phosphoglycerate synthase [Streptomyces zingiberis]NJP99990.1 glucosyl-3-phosphoglycerate synthase [Streptomyces zingiberis]